MWDQRAGRKGDTWLLGVEVGEGYDKREQGAENRGFHNNCFCGGEEGRLVLRAGRFQDGEVVGFEGGFDNGDLAAEQVAGGFYTGGRCLCSAGGGERADADAAAALAHVLLHNVARDHSGDIQSFEAVDAIIYFEGDWRYMAVVDSIR